MIDYLEFQEIDGSMFNQDLKIVNYKAKTVNLVCSF